MVIPVGTVVTAATGVKKRSRGQGLFLESVKWSRTIFKLGNSGQDINVLRVSIAHSVVKCVRSNGQGPICGAVKRSSNKNDGQNFLTPVAAVTTAPIGVTTPCEAQYGDLHMQFTTCTGTNLSRTIYKSLQHRVSSGLVASNETMRVYM